MGTRFKDILDSTYGIRFIFSKLNLSSALSATLIKESKIMTEREDIIKAYRELKEFSDFVNLNQNNSLTEKIKIELCEIRDIRSTLKRVSEGSIPDDIELFEIKSLSMINQKVKIFMESTDIKCIKLPDLEGVTNLLDPEGSRITSFYIYDAYSDDLRMVRKELSSKKLEPEEAIYKMSLIEDRIRGDISAKLRERISDIYESLIELVAPPSLIIYLHASVPVLVQRIENRGREFEQKVDPEYLGELNELYEEWTTNFKLAPVLRVDTDNINFIEDKEALEKLSQEIMKSIPNQPLPLF